MWFRSRSETSQERSSRKMARRGRRAIDRRQNSRRLLLEGLEDRRLMAFDVLAEYATAYSTQAMELAPIDADSRPDLVLIENGRVTIRPGNADGSFGDPLFSTGEIFAQSVVTGDFDNDGVTDLLTSSSGQLNLRIGNGDGSFQQPQIFGVPEQWEPLSISPVTLFGQYINSVATGDVNDDGKLDLVVGGTTSVPTGIGCGYYSCGYTYSYNGYVNVLLGTGTGAFSFVDADPSDPNVNAHPLGAYQSASSLAIEDVNDDGQRDVVASKFYGGIAALLGDGTGALQAPLHSGSGSGFSSVSLGDLDGDSHLDTISRSGNSLILHKGQGDGTFLQGAVLNAGLTLQSAVMGDVNGDGKLDLVAAGIAPCTYYGYYYGCYDASRTRQASVLLGDGQGDFSLPIVSALGISNASYSNLIDLALADLTGDSLPDLVTIDSGYQQAAIVAVNDGNWVEPEELSIADVTVVEGDSGSVNAVFTVTLAADPGGPVTVDFVVFDYYDYGGLGAAQAGVDYTAQSGTLIFGSGVLSQTITVPVFGDRIGEGDETFLVRLSNPTGALLRDAEAVGTIADNEPTISIDHPYGIDPLTVVEGDGGTTPAEFIVTLSQPYDQEVTVDYYTASGHTSDIIAASGTLHFLPGETSQTIEIQVVNDLIYEDLEAFNVYLTNPSPNSAIVNAGGYCFIEDNDPAPTLAINDVSRNEGNRKTAFKFTISLSAPVSNWVYVNYATADGTATVADGDYSAASGTAAIAPGTTGTTISVNVRGDKRQEPNETFVVNLSDPSGAAMADSQGVGTILNDDGGKAGRARKLRVSDSAVNEGTGGTTAMLFTVSLSAPSDKEISVQFATKNGTAKTSGNDYVAQSGWLVFAPGETTKTVEVEIKGDSRREGHEYLFLELRDASGATIQDPLGFGRIRNDDRG